MNSPEMHLQKAGKAQVTCQVCEGLFTPKRASWAKFCSTKCRNAHHSTLTPKALHKRIGELEAKVAALQKDAHPPFDFDDLVKRLQRLEAIARGEVMP
jgi:hypothetical protein